MFRLNAPLRKRRPSSPPVSGVLGGVPRPAPGVTATYVRAGRRAQACALGRGRVHVCWPAGARPTLRSRMGAACLRMGGEEESLRTGDSNPGCNYLVRGYSPSMHFFWGGNMPHYSPPLDFQWGRVGCRCLLASPRGRPARGSRTCALASVLRPVPRVPARPLPRLSAHPRTHLAATAPRFSPVCAPLLAEFFNFLTDISV